MRWFDCGSGLKKHRLRKREVSLLDQFGKYLVGWLRRWTNGLNMKCSAMDKDQLLLWLVAFCGALSGYFLWVILDAF